MKGAGSKNAWALFLLLLAGVVLGGFIGELAKGVPALHKYEFAGTEWLNPQDDSVTHLSARGA